jgi:hypothetical protein
MSPVVATTLLLVLLGATAANSQVYVVCQVGSGEVLIERSLDENRHVLMEGPLPGERTANIWIEENCPDRSCTESGACGIQGATRSSGGQWLVVCDLRSGSVGTVQAPPPSGFLLLPGRDGFARQHPSRESASAWGEQNCPSWRCDNHGACVATGGSTGSGWVAGELTSKTLSSDHASTPPSAREKSAWGPTGSVGGPPAADLSPLIQNTRTAAGGCSYPAALASVEQMANFDPEHPWYVANRDKIWRLAERQRQTEQTIWLASSALQANNWNRARELAFAAANIAVSCQAPAVSSLLGGIDTAIKQIQEHKQLKRQQAASRLLPGLISLSNAMIGAQSGVPVNVEALIAEVGPSMGLDLPLGTIEPCAFNYAYPSESGMTPECSCGGYRFDPGQFRCVR